MIKIDIPLPTPFLVISSPNHNKKHVPAVKIIVTLKYSNEVALSPKNENAITSPCINARAIPKYLVILFNFVLPVYPSFARFEK